MAIHLGPPVARRLMRPTRGLGSAPLPHRRLPADGLRPPIWPCSGWSLPVSLRSTACADDRHRHCGTGPRLTADGRTRHPALRSSDFPHAIDGSPRPDAQPSDRLADPSILPGVARISRSPGDARPKAISVERQRRCAGRPARSARPRELAPARLAPGAPIDRSELERRGPRGCFAPL